MASRIGILLIAGITTSNPAVAQQAPARGQAPTELVQLAQEFRTMVSVPGEPQGSRRHDGQTTLDLRAQRRTRLPKGASLDLMLWTPALDRHIEMFDRPPDIAAGDRGGRRVQRVQLQHGHPCRDPEQLVTNFLRPAEIMLPRALRFGVRLNF
jgi:hypothetical protein